MLILVAATYLGVALKWVYGQGWLATLAKALVLMVVYELLLIAWMSSAIAMAFTVLV